MGLNLTNRHPNKIKTTSMDNDHGWVWLVYRIDQPANKWHLQGVTDTEQLAIDLCLTADYLIGPVPKNTSLPEARIKWVGAYFPLADKPVPENIA